MASSKRVQLSSRSETSKFILADDSERTAWNKFLEFCSDHALSSWWFRGVSDASQGLIPTIGRKLKGTDWYKPSKPGAIDHFTREKRILRAFQRRARLELRIPIDAEFEWLAVAQHHGVPTRLLDWTTNPLMAAWFATSSTTDAGTACIYAAHIKSDHIRDEQDLDPFDRTMKEPICQIASNCDPDFASNNDPL